MAKVAPIEIKITGSLQEQQINEVFDLKVKADDAALEYDTKRAGALPMIRTKIWKAWKNLGKTKTGVFNFVLPSGIVRQITVQNNTSRKTYRPDEAKPILEKINATCGETKMKSSDIFTIINTYAFNSDAMSVPKVREAVLLAMKDLQAKMHQDGLLSPETTLLDENRMLKLAPHAVGRITALSNDIEASFNALGDPVGALITIPKQKATTA